MPQVDFGTLAWLAGIPDLAMLFGMAVVQWKTPGKRLEALFQHFGAGVVLCAVSVEILPLLLTPEHKNLWDFVGIATGFTIGVAAMLVIARFGPDQRAIIARALKRKSIASPGRLPDTAEGIDISVGKISPESGSTTVTEAKEGEKSLLLPKKEQRRGLSRLPWGMIIPVCTDACIDGLLIGVSFVAGRLTVGLIMSLALAIEMCFLGATTSTMVKKNKVPVAVAIPMCILIPQIILLSSFAGASILSSLSGPFFVAVLSFGVAALLFLVSDELLVEAHRDGESDCWYVTVFFFLGFASVIVMGQVSDSIGHTSESSDSRFIACS